MYVLLADKLREIGSPNLAENDARIASAVYGLRERDLERRAPDGYGYRTWLTHESRIVAAASGLIGANRGDRFLMRPEHLLHFLAFAPSVEQARRRMRDYVPSLLGLRMSRRVPARGMQRFMERVTEAGELESARREASISRTLDQLRTEHFSRYGERDGNV